MFPLVNREARPERGLARTRVSPFGLLRDEFEPLFERLLNRWAIPEDWFREVPAWEVTAAEKEVVYRIPLPGFEVHEVELSTVGNELTLRAEHRVPEEAPATAEPVPRERIELTVTLPAGLEPERMEARLHNGMLEVHVPRVPAAVPRRLEIRG